MRLHRSKIGPILCLALLAGCSSAIQEPEVRLDRISVGTLGLEGGVLRVRLHVLNPNSFGIQAEGLEYLIEVSEGDPEEPWTALSEGRFTDRITVEADDSALVEIPVRFRYRDLGTAVTAMLATGSFDYRVSGRVHLVEPLRREIPFRRSGAIDELMD
ncbi:MAG TPA: LEA type 2 family protein [Longimicrobiales bacterium]|nr:LEA type 2 family protein [Longimicrobiales bacterium]